MTEYLTDKPVFRGRGRPHKWHGLLKDLPKDMGVVYAGDSADDTVRNGIWRYGKQTGKRFRLFVNPETKIKSIWREE